MARKLREDASKELQGQMVSGYFVKPAWTQHAAQLLKSYQAGAQEREAEKSIKDANQQFGSDFENDLLGLNGEDLGPSEILRFGSKYGKEYADALRNMNKDKSDMAHKQMVANQNAELKRDQMELTKTMLGEGKTSIVFDPRSNQNVIVPAQQAIGMQPQRQLKAVPVMKDGRSVYVPEEDAIGLEVPRSSSSVEVLKTDDGIQLVDKGLGTTQKLGDPAAPIRTQDQGDRIRDAQSAINTKKSLVRNIEESISALSKGDASGSTLGEFLHNTVAGKGLGMSTDAAKANATLEMISGSIISTVDKMPGAASNLDVQLYKQMAGQLGDASIPLPTRMSTAKKMLEMTQGSMGPLNKMLQNAIGDSSTTPQSPAALTLPPSNPSSPTPPPSGRARGKTVEIDGIKVTPL